MPRRKRRGIPNLGERIVHFMEAANLDASELSARTGISVSYLTRILQGKVVNPTIDFVSRLAAGLGVTETQLLRDEDGDFTFAAPLKTPQRRSDEDRRSDEAAQLRQLLAQVDALRAMIEALIAEKEQRDGRTKRP